MKTVKPVNLLWTSGQDSTFRLLELLLILKKPVQTYYILDRTRKSLELEIKAMEKIRRLIAEKAPKTVEIFKPTIYKELNEIKANPSITEKYDKIYSTYSLGPQNEWLARFADEMNMYDLEMSIEARASFLHPFISIIMSNLIAEEEDGFTNFRLKEDLSFQELSLFKYFKFPLIKRTKAEMIKIAKEHSFLDILNHSWFCHMPINEKACGICKPCRIAIGEGMWKRIPMRALFRNFKVYRLKPLINQVPLKFISELKSKSA